MDATENVDVVLGELHEEKTAKRKRRKCKVKKSLSDAKNLETDVEKLAGESNGSGREETMGMEIGDDVQEGEQVLRSCHVGVDDKIASGDKGIDLDATGDVAASCNVDEEKKGSKRKKGSKKEKDISAAVISENILGTEGENMAFQTQNKGMEQITGNKVIEGTEMHNQSGAQDAVLLKSSPLSGDGNTIFKDTIDQDVIKNDVTVGSFEEEKKDNKTPKKHKSKSRSLDVNPEKNMATKGATGDVAASCNVNEEKKGSKRKNGSKKEKDVSAAVISENILGTERENMACQTQNKGMEQITGNKVIEGTEMHNQSGAQDAVLLKSSPLSGDGNTIFKDTIDQAVTKNDVTVGSFEEEKKDNKTPKKHKRKSRSLDVNPEKNMATKGENLASQNEISELGLTTVNQDVEENEMGHGAQDSGLSSSVGVDHNSVLEDKFFGQDTTVKKEENGKQMPKKWNKKKALSVTINSEPNLQKGDKLPSRSHITRLEPVTGNETHERTEMGDGSQECCLLPQELVGTDSLTQCITFNQETQSLQNQTTAHLRDNICKQETMLDIMKNDVCSDHCVSASEVAVLDAENPVIYKKKGKKRKHESSSVSQSKRNDEDGEKDGNVDSSYVNEGESKNTREPNNATAVPIAASISENTVLDIENANTCKKKLENRNHKVSSVSQSNLTNEDGEKDRNIESSSVNDGESKHSREGINVALGEGIPLTSSISHSDSIKDVCGRVYNSESNHDKILVPPPKRQCGRPPSRKLLILDINGLLADIVSPVPFGYKPDLMLSRKAVFKRPFCESFLKFCFEKFDVGVWSSRVKINVDNALNFLMGEMKNKLVFYWDRSHCTITGFPTIENRDKPLVLKELGKLWDDPQFHLGKYEHCNTLLLDDSPYKALCNPADTAIFPLSYQYSDVNDCSLGPGGDLRVYLERLAMADSIPEFVRNNHFGQRPIRETNLSWNYYKKVIDSRKSLGKQ